MMEKYIMQMLIKRKQKWVCYYEIKENSEQWKSPETERDIF